MMKITQVHTLNLTGFFSESQRILVARLSQFVTLSLLFIPLSLSLIIIPTLPTHLFIHNISNNPKLLISYLFYILTVYFLALCAIGTITYTAHHAFFGNLVNPLDTLKSLTFSFFPLASTAIAAYVLIVLITISFLMFVGAVLMLVHNLGYVMDYNSVYFMWFSAIMGLILIAIIIYLHVEWSLAIVVVVVESKWGFAALRRSSYLVKGMRLVSLIVMWCAGGVAGFGWVFLTEFNWVYIFVTMLTWCLSMFSLARFTIDNTVLYNYCKALHGELAIDVAEPGGLLTTT